MTTDAHPEAPRDVWAHVRDDAPLPPRVASLSVPPRAHPTLTALRMRLGSHLDTGALGPEYLGLRATSDELDEAGARSMIECLHRALRSKRDVLVRIGRDGQPRFEAPAHLGPLRAGTREWAWIRVYNDADHAARVAITVDGRRRRLRLPAGGSRSFLSQLPHDHANELQIAAATDGATVRATLRLDTWPTRQLRLTASGGPVRLYVEDELGPVLPGGAAARRDLHGRWYVQLRRRATIRVVGRARIEARRGPEWQPVRLELGPGDIPDGRVRLAPARRWDPAAGGWASADLHAHLHYGGEHLLDVSSAALAQQAEGLWFLNLVVANQESDTVHDRSSFSHTPQTARHAVTSWGEEFRNDFYGHICLTGPRRLVEPVYSGFRGTRQAHDFPSTVDTAQRSRTVGALISSAHPIIGGDSIDEIFAHPRSVEAKELPVLAALGLVDAVDVMSYPGDARSTARLWYRLLDCGLRVAASAGSDAFMNVADGAAFMHGEPGMEPGWGARFSSPVGGMRLYARLDQHDRDGLAEAIRAGRTFVTNGPFLDLSVDGQGPGSVLSVAAGSRLAIDAEVASWVDVSALELIVNGRARRRLALAPGPAQARTTWSLPITRPCWIALRAIGGPHEEVMDDYAFAHTSAVYVNVDGQHVRRPASAAHFVRWIDRLDREVAEHCSFEDPRQERMVRDAYTKARRFYASERGT